MIVSDHLDAVCSVERGDGTAKRPEDDPESFAAFIRENLNQLPALLIVTQRPRDLTRAELRGGRLDALLGDLREVIWEKATG